MSLSFLLGIPQISPPKGRPVLLASIPLKRVDEQTKRERKSKRRRERYAQGFGKRRTQAEQRAYCRDNREQINKRRRELYAEKKAAK